MKLQGGKTRFGRSRATVDPGRLRVVGRGGLEPPASAVAAGPALRVLDGALAGPRYRSQSHGPKPEAKAYRIRLDLSVTPRVNGQLKVPTYGQVKVPTRRSLLLALTSS